MSDYKILVAEDNPTHRVLLNYLLINELKIKNVEFSNDGNEAYQKLEDAAEKEMTFDCIILDHDMPILTGITVIKMY
jgi:CheY-like chemotaxis protein